MFGNKARNGFSRLLLTAATLAGALSPALADGPLPVSLAELENRARAYAPSARLAQAEVAVAEQRSAATQARQGARLFGGADLGQAREPVTDTLSRDYRRIQGQVGVRWPLLGSRATQERDAQDADRAVARSRLQRQQIELAAVQALRRGYVQHQHSAQRNRIAQAFLHDSAEVQDQLLRRRNAGALLEADRLDLTGLYQAVKAVRDSQQAAQSLALADMARLSGHPVPAVREDELLLPEGCLSAPALAAQAERQPSVQMARLDLDAAQQHTQHARLDGLEAGVSVAQSFSRDVGGSSGHSTRVGVDFSVPLQWRAQRDAALAQAQADTDHAHALVELRRSEWESAVQRALADYQLRNQEMPARMHRLQAAQEALRIARLRLQAFDGDGYSKLIMARHALYQAAQQVVDSAELRDLAALELLGLHGDCTPVQPEAAATAPGPLATALSALASPVAVASAATTSPAMAVQSPRTAQPPGPGLSWYVWQGQALLERPERLRELPAGTLRLMLSFTAPQLQALISPAGRAGLQAFVTQARAAGLRVELLLGEPTWVLPEGREQLLALIDSLRGLPFDGLHLDLERSQLPAAQQQGWSQLLMATLRAVRARTDAPIALTTHHRELRDPRFAARVHAAGVHELVAMVYVNNPERAAALARPLLRGPEGLGLTVAQSIERALPADESSFRAGRAASLERWNALAQRLAPLPRFRGIAVQAWEDYVEAQP